MRGNHLIAQARQILGIFFMRLRGKTEERHNARLIWFLSCHEQLSQLINVVLLICVFRSKFPANAYQRQSSMWETYLSVHVNWTCCPACWYLLQRVYSHKRSWWTLDARLEFPSLLPIYVRVEVIQIWLLNKRGSVFKSNYLENTFQSSPTRVDSMTFQNTDCTLLSLFHFIQVAI